MKTIRVDVTDKHLANAFMNALEEVGYTPGGDITRRLITDDSNCIKITQMQGYLSKSNYTYWWHDPELPCRWDVQFTLPRDWHTALEAARELIQPKKIGEPLGWVWAWNEGGVPHTPGNKLTKEHAEKIYGERLIHWIPQSEVKK